MIESAQLADWTFVIIFGCFSALFGLVWKMLMDRIVAIEQRMAEAQISTRDVVQRIFDKLERRDETERQERQEIMQDLSDIRVKVAALGAKQQ